MYDIRRMEITPEEPDSIVAVWSEDGEDAVFLATELYIIEITSTVSVVEDVAVHTVINDDYMNPMLLAFKNKNNRYIVVVVNEHGSGALKPDVYKNLETKARLKSAVVETMEQIPRKNGRW